MNFKKIHRRLIASCMAFAIMIPTGVFAKEVEKPWLEVTATQENDSVSVDMVPLCIVLEGKEQYGFFFYIGKLRICIFERYCGPFGASGRFLPRVSKGNFNGF